MGKIAIILAYYDGAKYLDLLLESIFNQTYDDFKIFIFDDNSPIPLTKDKLQLTKYEKSKITIHNRIKNLGFSKNFLDGLSMIDSNYSFFSFCDQDDIWEKDKLERGITALKSFPKDIPSLYGTKTLHINESGENIIGKSISIKRKLSFKNALLQNFAGGNTMIFNFAAKELMISSMRDINPVSHDWWIYLLVEGNGGIVVYDKKPSLLYRQHNKNIMGSNNTFLGKIRRLFKLFDNSFKNYIDSNLDSLDANRDLLKEEHLLVLNYFCRARRSNIFKRIFFYLKSGVYRQNISGNFIFFLLVVLNRI